MAVPDWWLAEGNEIRVERAPTHFGLVSLTVTGTEKGVHVEFDPPNRQPPKRIFLYLPRSRQLITSVEGIEVVVRSALIDYIENNGMEQPSAVQSYLPDL